MHSAGHSAPVEVGSCGELARQKGTSVSRLALAWVVQQPTVHSTIIGPRTLEQLEDNLAAQSVELNQDDLARIDKLCPPGEHVVPFYNAAFGPDERW